MTTRIDDGWLYAGLVPPRRLGVLLGEARAVQGVTLEQLAERAPTQLTLSRLSSIERGSVELDDAEIEAVARLYGLDATSVVPPRSRLVVDLDEGILRIDGRRSSTEVGDGADRREVLSRYLALVYSMRSIEPGERLVLRGEDLEVLGTALRIGRDVVRADLDALMVNPGDVVGWRHRLLRRKVLVPAAGVLVSFCGAAALIMVPGASADTDPAPATTPVTAEIGTAVVQERNPDGTPGPVVVRGTESADPIPTSGAALIDPGSTDR